jgi:hypothetical protein
MIAKHHDRRFQHRNQRGRSECPSLSSDDDDRRVGEDPWEITSLVLALLPVSSWRREAMLLGVAVRPGVKVGSITQPVRLIAEINPSGER